MHISFVLDEAGKASLLATLSSLIANCSDPSQLEFWFFHSALKDKSCKQIVNHLQDLGIHKTPKFILFDAAREFGHLKAMHGTYVSYGKLLIPSFIDAPSVLYLDTDVIIQTDCLQLGAVKLHNHLLAAVADDGGGKKLDQTFLVQQLGWLPDAPYFNSGVMYINCNAWRQRNIQQEVNNLAKMFKNNNHTHDQVIFNALCNKQFIELDLKWNYRLGFNADVEMAKDAAIVHFVGYKPWDFLGRYLHNGHKMYKQYTSRQSALYIEGIAYWKRTWKIKRQILHAFQSR